MITTTLGRYRAPLAISVVVAILASVITVVTAGSASAAGAPLSVSQSAPATALLGEAIPVSLTLSNPPTLGAVDQYNASFRYVLPAGVTFKTGSSAPASAGAPRIINGPGVGETTLLWSNLADLPVGTSYRLSFSIIPDGVILPVGSVIDLAGEGFASTDPRRVPKFDASGAPIADPVVAQVQAPVNSVQLSAIAVSKSEPSVEGELLRGVHDHPTVYTIEVRNNDSAATNAVTVTDYIPAGMEFLGCGGVDNSTSREYPGAASLTATPVISATNCPTPTRVETVTNPPAEGTTTYPAGVYTKVTWSIGNLAAGATRRISYAAGIPLRANTTTFSGGTPTATSRLQTANLNNNTGTSSREGASEASLTNTVRVAGTYTGAVAIGASTTVSASDTESVTIEDAAVVKSASPTVFTQGGIATFTFTVRTSEYTSATDAVLTELLPAGLCPLSATTDYSGGSISGCGAVAGTNPTGASFDAVEQLPDGSFRIRFTGLTISANGTATVKYQARMLSQYPATGQPTAAGDRFTDTVTLAATTQPISGTGESGSQVVGDTSSATLVSAGLPVTKTVMPQRDPYTCDLGPYVKPASSGRPATDFTFRKGERICFELTVPFPADIDSRNVVVTDFLPDGTAYEAGSAVVVPVSGTPTFPITFNESAAAAGTADPQWILGTDNGGDLFVPKGAVFKVRLSVLVQRTADSTVVDIADNLLKVRDEATDGTITTRRDDVGFSISPAPPVEIVKGVERVVSDGTTDLINPVPGSPTNTDGTVVQEGDTVRFRIDVSNTGTAATGDDYSVQQFDVWDVLPPGITCALVAGISAVSTASGAPVGVCTDPGDPNQPSFAQQATLSAIRWQARAGTADAIAPGGRRTLTYDIEVPSPTRAGAVLTDTAAVRSFAAEGEQGDVQEYFPSDNIDTTVGLVQQNAAAASDTSNVRLSDVSLTKALVSTGITAPGNSATQAVNGETATYRVSVIVPPGTSVFNGALTDPLPTGVQFVSATAGFSATGTSPATGSLPAGVTFNAANGSLTLPTTYTNPGPAAHRFDITISARVTPTASSGTKTNTATFASRESAGGTALPNKTATANLVVVVPSPTLTKTDGAGGNVVESQTVTYTLRASNAANRPDLHDIEVTDCIPKGLTFAAFGAITQGTAATPVAGNGTNGCPVGTTRVLWKVGTLAGGIARTLIYTATVDRGAVGGTRLTNQAGLVGSTLDNAVNDPSVERVLTTAASDTVTVVGATIAKTVAPAARTIGQTATFTATVTIPAKVTFYNLAVIDRLPAGFDRTTLTTDTVECVNADASTCDLNAEELVPEAQLDGSTLLGWNLGNATAATQARTVRITYSVAVKDLAGVTRGNALSNAAYAKWDSVAGPAPTSPSYSFTQGTPQPAVATVIVEEPLLAVDKTVSDTTPEPGQQFTYTIKVTNSNAANVSTAYNTVVTDTVPVGVVVKTPLPAGAILTGAGVNGGGTITWTVSGTILTGANKTLSYNAVLAPSASLTTAALTNTADITAYRSLPGSGRLYDGPSDPATVRPAFPVLTVTKTTPAGPVAYLGEDFLWRIEVKNTGGGRALSVDVSDALPPNWQYVIGTATVTVGSSATVATEPAIGIAGAVQTLSFNDIGDLGVGDTAVILLRARPLPAAATTPGVGASIKHTNTVVATATDATGAPGNAVGPYRGSGSADARIDSADVVMTKTHATPVIAGAGLSWRLTVSNSGPDQAVGPFTVADTVPTGAELVSATGTGWSCDINGRQVSCTRTNGADTLNSGSSFPVITVVQRVPADTASGTTFVNEATVDARTFDPNVPNNTDPDTAVVTTAADLAITKRLEGPMVAGREATYTLDVINRGPSVAQGTITVADAVPAGTTFVSASGSGWNCALASGTITCQRSANLGVQVAAPQITVIVDVDQGRTSAVTNTATVSGPTTDPDPSNNSSTVEKVPDTSADLVMQKSSTAPVVAGSTGVYRLRVRNLGPSAAQAVTIVDPLPTGLTYQSFSSVNGSWSCSASGQSVTCSLSGAQDAGTTTEVDITVQASSGLSGDVINTATVNSTTPDPDPSNNTDSDTSPPVTSADLSITKSHTAAAIAGSNLAFTLTVSNNGPSDSQGPITVTDVLPSQMSFVSASGTGWSCSHSSGTITCTRGATLVASADAPAITVVALIDPDAGPAQLANTAVVDPGPTEDPDLFNNTSIDEVEVRDSANVVLAKTVTGANPVTAGSSTSFAITVTNEGPSTADDVVVVDSLPAGFESASVSGSGWSCEPVVDLQISCRRDALAPGAAPALTVVAQVLSGTNDAAVLTNTASVSTATPGDDPADNEDSASVTVRTRADLVLTKTADAPRTEAGGSASFTIAVTNDGPSDAAGDIVVTDSLPPGLRYSDVTGPWDCVPGAVSPSGQQVVCTLADNAGIPAGGAAPDLTLLVEVDGAADPGDYSNTAEADSPTVDPDPSNNSDDADITVERVVDLSITKTHDPEPVIGQSVTFTMVVTNKGPSQARSVVSSDVLPAGLEPVSADGADDGWTCAVDGQRVSCALENPLEAGSSATYTVTATVLPSAYPQVTNTATTSSDIDDEDPSDNSAADRLIVPPLVDLSITKSHSGSFTVGSTGTYTLTVRNNGPTNDPGPITVTDDLPAGLSFVSATGTGWSCSKVGSTVTCIRAQGLAADATSRISLKVAVGTAAEPGVTNTAVVSTPSAETDTQNNADDDPTEVLAAARLSVIKDLVRVKGREATYRITVTNKGPSTTTTPIVVTDSLPAGLSYVSASGEAWACAHRAPVVTCTYIDPMIKGLSASFTVVTTVAQSATGQIRNIAVATGGSPSSGTSTGSSDLLLPTGSGTAKTGAAVAALLLAALAMLAAGAGMVRASRRKPNP